MTAVAVLGAGQVGAHAARQLLATEGVDEVLLHDVDRERARAAAAEIGTGAVALEGALDDLLSRRPAGLAVAVGDGVPALTAAVEYGIPSASVDDDPATVRRLFELDAAAQAAGVTVVAGAGLAPGLSEVVAGYASERSDDVEEVHVARYGVSGPACVRRRRSGSWGPVTELEGGAWAHPHAGTGRRLVAFPEPIGSHDCRRAVSAVPSLVARTIPTVTRASFRDAARRRDRVTGAVPPPARGRTSAGLGGLHVEVRARRGSDAEVLVYGTVDLMAPMVGAVLAVATLAACGTATADVPDAGVIGLGQVGAAAVLSELARRGVRVAQFTGG